MNRLRSMIFNIWWSLVGITALLIVVLLALLSTFVIGGSNG